MTDQLPMQRRSGEIAVAPSRLSGAVRWFSQEKGYGFIVPDDESEDLFVRFSAIRGEGFLSLHGSQRVTFEAGSDGRGPRALDVVTEELVADPADQRAS